MHFLGQKVTFPTHIPQTAWLRHGPFAMWLVRAARPRLFVELGTDYGFSYFSFCEAVRGAGINTQCFAVDTWKGDDHARFYGENVFEAVKEANEPYKSFSTLKRMTFEEALKDVEDGSVDLLHVDGRHGYEDVKNDFETWQKKLSKNAIGLFHDTCVERPGFGVQRYWEELCTQYQGFNFTFQNGLGVVFLGDPPTDEISQLRKLVSRHAGRETLDSLFFSYSESFVQTLRHSKSVECERARLQSQKELLCRVVGRKADIESRSRATSLVRQKIKYKVTRALSKSRLPLSERRRDRFRRSAEKSAPASSLPWTAGPSPSVPCSALPKDDAKTLRETAIHAITTAKSAGYQAAIPEFEELESVMECIGAGLDSLCSLDFMINANEPSRQGPVALPSIEGSYFGARKDVVIYTALFGDYDRLPPICTPDCGFDFICFTDQDIKAPGWTIKHHEPMFEDSNLSAKYFKLNPHIVFPNRVFSLFVDANTLFIGRMESFINRWLLKQDFALWRHPNRQCIFDEAEAIILHGRSPPAKVARQMAAYERSSTPRREGLYECSFLWRRHMAPNIRAFNEAWWKEVTTQTKRDQLSFYHLTHTQGPKPTVLPDQLGTSRANLYFSKLPHQPRNHKRLSKPNRKPLVTFLYDKASEHSGSTVMRSMQLPAFLQRELGDLVQIQTTTDAESVNDSLVIVGKRMIDTISSEALRRLRKRNIALAADPVDAAVSGHKLAEFDIMIAASLKALQSRLKAEGNLDRYLVTHHADPRIVTKNPLNDRLRVGYFGELVNTVGHGRLDHLIDYHLVNTRQADHSWLGRLSDYNAHFAVRQDRAIDESKPFTKGFVAARCGAVVLCRREEGDSSYYLGDDYPFYLDDPSPAALEYAIAQMTMMFRGPEWQYACEIMNEVRHRSSEAWISKEFSHIINDIWRL